MKPVQRTTAGFEEVSTSTLQERVLDIAINIGGWFHMDPLSAYPLGENASCILNQLYAPNVEAATVVGSSRTLDLYVPAGDGPFPLIMWVHGGGWHSGDKQPEGARLAATFLPHGFAVATVAYRLTPEAPFPAQVEDCDLALAWLRRHAAACRIDPARVGLIGHSAGAHLCALMAVVGGRGVWEGVRQPVQAVVCWSPPCDLDRERGAWPRNMFVWNPQDKFSQTFFPGGLYHAEFARRASPASHVHGDVPPLLVVHGDQDTVVPIGQARAFRDRLKELGVNAEFRTATGRGHDVMEEETEAEALRFFKRVIQAGSLGGEAR